MKTIQTTLTAAAIVAGASLISAGQSHAALIIDDFTTFQKVVDSTIIGGAVVGDLNDAAVLGGWRTFSANKTAGGGVGIEIFELSDDVSSRFYYEQGSTVGRGTGEIIYDGTNAATFDSNGFNPAVDLTQGGTLTDFVFYDVTILGPGLVMTVTLYNDSSASTSVQTVNLVPANLLGGNLYLPYAAFTNPANAINVGAIKVTITGTALTAAGSDVSFDLIASNTVPEPSAAFVVLGGVAMALARRTRRGA